MSDLSTREAITATLYPLAFELDTNNQIKQLKSARCRYSRSIKMSADPDGGIGAKNMSELKTNPILKHAREIILKHEKGFVTYDELEKIDTECDRPRRTKEVRGEGAKTKLRKQNATDAAEIYEGDTQKNDEEQGKLDATNLAKDQKTETGIQKEQLIQPTIAQGQETQPTIIQDRGTGQPEVKPSDDHPTREEPQGKRNLQTIIDRFDISSTSSTSSEKSGSREPDPKKLKK